MATYPIKTCGNCGSSTGSRGSALGYCGKSKCNVESYCSAACRRSHWLAHRTQCAGGPAKAALGKNNSATTINEMSDCHLAQAWPSLTAFISTNERQESKTSISAKNTSGGAQQSNAEGRFGYKPGLLQYTLGHDKFVGTGVWITPYPCTQAAGGYACGLTVASRAEVVARSLYHTDTELQISREIGFPIHLYGPNGSDSNPPNVYTALLGIDPNPHAVSFDELCWSIQPSGGTIVTRKDREPLHINQISALVQFCSMVRNEVVEMRKTGSTAAKKTNLAAKFLSPAAFKKYFEDMRKTEQGGNPQAWAGVGCPV